MCQLHWAAKLWLENTTPIVAENRAIPTPCTESRGLVVQSQRCQHPLDCFCPQKCVFSGAMSLFFYPGYNSYLTQSQLNNEQTAREACFSTGSDIATSIQNPATMATLNLAATAVMDGYVSVVISMPTVAMLVGSLAVFVCLLLQFLWVAA